MKDIDTKIQESVRLTLALGKWPKRAAKALKKLALTPKEIYYLRSKREFN